MIHTILNLLNLSHIDPYARTKATEQANKDWKKPVELHYHSTKQLLSITTMDCNVKEYYRSTSGTWKRYPSYTPIKDNELINKLNQHYASVITGRKTREGYIKELR